MAQKNEKMLAEAPFRTLVLKLCVPTIVIMVVMVVYNMADVFFIGQTGDPYMIAAVSLCGPMFSLLSGIGTLLGSGGCTVISLALGRGDKSAVQRTSSLCFYGALLLGALFSVIVLGGLNRVCVLLGADETTLSYTRDYLIIIAAAAPVTMFTNVFTNLIRADGAASASMAANLAGTVTNIILDPVFILGLHMGVSGAAIATILGNIVSAVYLIFYVTRRRPDYSLRIRDLSLRAENVFPVVSLGLPLAFSTVLMSFTHVIANNRMMQYGAIAVAARSVAGRLGMLATMIIMGICMGMQPAISYSYARGDRARLRSVLKGTGVTAVVLGAAIAAVCWVLREPVLLAFIDSQEVLELGRSMVLPSVLVGPFYALYQLMTTYLQATGRAGYATMASLLNKAILFLPALFVLEALFGMYGIVYSGFAADVLSVPAAYLLVRLSRSKGAQEKERERADSPMPSSAS